MRTLEQELTVQRADHQRQDKEQAQTLGSLLFAHPASPPSPLAAVDEVAETNSAESRKPQLCWRGGHGGRAARARTRCRPRCTSLRTCTACCGWSLGHGAGGWRWLRRVQRAGVRVRADGTAPLARERPHHVRPRGGTRGADLLADLRLWRERPEPAGAWSPEGRGAGRGAWEASEAMPGSASAVAALNARQWKALRAVGQRHTVHGLLLKPYVSYV